MATSWWGDGVFSHRSRKSDIVHDAVLLATASVRIAVKNQLIVRALRDGADFDAAWWRSTVAREFTDLATEYEADATRLAAIRAAVKGKAGKAAHPADFRARDRPLLKRRIRVLHRIAARLRELGSDEDAVVALVGEARSAALDEITTARQEPQQRATVDPVERAAALRELAADLAALEASSD